MKRAYAYVKERSRDIPYIVLRCRAVAWLLRKLRLKQATLELIPTGPGYRVAWPAVATLERS